MVPAARAPRHLGLGSAGRADAHRGEPKRPQHPRRRANDEDEHALHLRSRTGEPLFGMEERPVPQTDLPGEATWPTQPFPIQPPPLSRTTFDPREGFLQPDARACAYCKRSLGDEQDVHEGHVHAARPRPDDGDVSEHARRRQLERVVLRSRARAGVLQHHEPRPGRANGETNRSENGPRRLQAHTPWGRLSAVSGIRETKVPCSAPPFGELLAVDVNRAAVVWRVPLGEFEELKARGFANTGTPNIGGTIATASGLVFVGANDRQAGSERSTRRPAPALGDDPRGERACHADDLHGTRRPAIRGHRRRRRRSARIASRFEDRRLLAAAVDSCEVRGPRCEARSHRHQRHPASSAAPCT